MQFSYNTFFVIIFFCILPFCGQSQSPYGMINDPNHQYEEIIRRGEVFFDSIQITTNNAPNHDAKVFARWSAFWANRLDYSATNLDGFQGAKNYYERQIQGEFNICNSSTANSQWSPFGPEIYIGRQPFSTNNIGVVNSVAWHPSNENIIYIGCNFSGVWKTIDGGQNWVNTTDYLRLPIMAVHQVAIEPGNPTTIFAGTGETTHNSVGFGLGLFRSTDSGTSWTRIWPTNQGFTSPHPQINVIRFHPNYQSNGQMIIAGGNQILKSNDFGNTFTEVYNTQTLAPGDFAQSFFDLEYKPGNPNVLMASTRKMVPRNANGFQSTAAQLLISLDGGQSWSCKTCGQNAIAPFEHATRFAIAPSVSENGFIILFPSDEFYPSLAGAFVKTSDGVNFKLTNKTNPIFSVDMSFHKAEFVVSPFDTNRMYLGGVSINNWDTVNNYFAGRFNTSIHYDIRALEMRADGPGVPERFLLGTDGGPTISNDAAQTFRSLCGNGLNITDFYGFNFYPESGDIVAGSLDNGTLKFEAGQWYHRKGGDGGWCEIDQKTPNHTVFGFGGFTWDWFGNNIQMTHTANSSPNSNGFRYLGSTGDINETTFLQRRAISDPSRNSIFYSGDMSYLKSVDMSSAVPQWSAPLFTKPNADGKHHLQDIGMSPADKNVMYLAYDQPFYGALPNEAFWVTKDYGVTWQDITLNLHTGNQGSPYIYYWKHITDIEVDPTNAAHLFVAISGYGWDTNTQQAIERVYESRDYGQTWRRMSNGLSPFPVNYLCYQNGSNGVLFAATDGGIYRFDPNQDKWECFNNGLPTTVFTRVLIDYCRGRVLASSFGRGMWEAPLPEIADYHVSQSEEWKANTVRYFANNVIVDAGATLTIKGKVSFAEGIRLIVKKGGKLKLLPGSLLTNDCGKFWEGIDVEGNVNRNQYITSNGYAVWQGIVEITGGTIENARTGISTALHDSNGNYYWNSFGGIVRCTNAKFLNNVRDVLMLSYTRQNLSHFNSCDFKTTRLLNDNANPDSHVGLWNVRNIPFTACNFENVDTSGYPPLNRGNGITAFDATYLIDWQCTNPTANGCNSGKPTKFQGLLYGIHQENSISILSPSIRHSQFKNNSYMGLKLRNVHFATLDENEFIIPNQSIPTALPTGIYLENCTRYSLQGNSFSSNVNAQSFGIIVHQGGDDVNYIYNNTFNNLTYAISAQEDNDGPLQKDGLIMQCNDFKNCTFGIMDQGVTSTAGVGDSQGWDVALVDEKPRRLVRNRYYGPCNLLAEQKFLISHPNQNTIEHLSNRDAVCQPIPQPDCSDPFLQVSSTVIDLEKIIHCPKIGMRSRSEINLELSANTIKVWGAKNTINTTIDGGDTPARLGFVQQTSSPGQLQNGLNSFSPYLSDTVLIAFLNKMPPSGTIRNVLMANSPLSSNVLESVNTASLPNGIRNQILAAQNGTSPRELLENDYYAARNDKQFWENEKIRYYNHDTLDQGAADSLTIALRDLNFANCYQNQALAFSGGFDAADSAMSSTSNCDGNIPQFEILAKALRFNGKQCCIFDDSNSPATHEEQLSTPASFSKAQLALDALFEWRSSEIQMPPTIGSQKIDDNEVFSTNSGKPFELKIYPNPAHDQFFLEFEGRTQSHFVLKIYDLAGRQIASIEVAPNKKNVIAFGKQPAGLYFYRLLENDKACKTGKIEVN